MGCGPWEGRVFHSSLVEDEGIPLLGLRSLMAIDLPVGPLGATEEDTEATDGVGFLNLSLAIANIEF